MTSTERRRDAGSPQPCDALEASLWLGASMLKAGSTAFRARECMEVLAKRLSFDSISVALTFDSVSASVGLGRERATATREIGLPGVNAWRIGELERLAQSPATDPTPLKITAEIARIESALPLYTVTQVALSVAVASGSFAVLNGCGMLETSGAAIGSGLGQALRAHLSRRHVNQYGTAAVCAVAASGTYAVLAALAARLGLGVADHPAGLMSSVLFLVPGFPLVAALLDLLQHQTVAAVSRFAYGLMLFLAATFGLSLVVGIDRIDLSPHPSVELGYALMLLSKGLASFLGGCGFAVLYNSPLRTVLAVGFLALGANELRLILHDAGMMLAPATFFGALAVGSMALFLERRLQVPRISMTVPGIIIMVPGVYAFEMIVFFNRGQMPEALQALALCSFIIGAMAMGLAAPRFFTKD